MASCSQQLSSYAGSSNHNTSARHDCPKRDKHSENDDADLADERAPTVEWLGKVNVHVADLPAVRERLAEGLMSAMGRSRIAAVGGKPISMAPAT